MKVKDIEIGKVYSGSSRYESRYGYVVDEIVRREERSWTRGNTMVTRVMVRWVHLNEDDKIIIDRRQAWTPQQVGYKVADTPEEWGEILRQRRLDEQRRDEARRADEDRRGKLIEQLKAKGVDAGTPWSRSIDTIAISLDDAEKFLDHIRKED